MSGSAVTHSSGEGIGQSSPFPHRTAKPTIASQGTQVAHRNKAMNSRTRITLVVVAGLFALTACKESAPQAAPPARFAGAQTSTTSPTSSVTASPTPSTDSSAAEAAAAAAAAKAQAEAKAKAEAQAKVAAAKAKAAAAAKAKAAAAATKAKADAAARAKAAAKAQVAAKARAAAQAKAAAAARAKAAAASVYYANCSAVRAAGAAPIYRGEPGYSRKLDRDGDGVACE